MIVYNYDANTGEYMDSKAASLDPLESDKQKKEVYLVPSYATTVEPPAIQEGFARCFIGEKWVQIEDHRGEKSYSTVDAVEKEILYLGEVEPGYSLLTPCEFPKWDGSKWAIDTAKQADSVRAERDALLRASDCTMLEDHPSTKKQDWKTYRQALRDIPNQAKFPTEVTWPVKPE